MGEEIRGPDELLPDSRLRDRSFGTIRGPGGNYEPVFCAFCGCKMGVVTARLFENVFAACNACVEANGAPPGEEVPKEVVDREAILEA